MIRAKFVVDKITKQTYSKWIKETGNSIKVEMQSIVLRPVYSDDPTSENRKFWEASPTGEITLGIINPEAWKEFELDKEYYIDFTKVE